MYLLFFVSLFISFLLITGVLIMMDSKTINSALLSKPLVNVELGGLDPLDHPDYADLFLMHAELEDGTVLTEDELDYIQFNSDITKYINK